MPFADDVRKYTFPSLERLINGKGEVVTKHPYIPTDDQMAMMENFVDALDLTEAGEEDEEGEKLHPHGSRFRGLLLLPPVLPAHARCPEATWAERRSKDWGATRAVNN